MPRVNGSERRILLLHWSGQRAGWFPAVGMAFMGRVSRAIVTAVTKPFALVEGIVRSTFDTCVESPRPSPLRLVVRASVDGDVRRGWQTRQIFESVVRPVVVQVVDVMPFRNGPIRSLPHQSVFKFIQLVSHVNLDVPVGAQGAPSLPCRMLLALPIPECMTSFAPWRVVVRLPVAAKATVNCRSTNDARLSSEFLHTYSLHQEVAYA